MMMKNIITIIILCLALVLLFGCDYITGDIPESELTKETTVPLATYTIEVVGIKPAVYLSSVYSESDFQQKVNAIKALQMDYDCRDRTIYQISGEKIDMNKYIRGEGWLDINEYFTILTHLSMAEGFVLDYVEYSYGTGSHPLIYPRKVDQEPLKNYEEYNLYSSFSDSCDIVRLVVDREQLENNKSSI
jgi:hypothetical protein